MVHLAPPLVEAMKGDLAGRPMSQAMAVFGISENSWVKVLDGCPIRKSVAERLMTLYASRGRLCPPRAGD